MEGAKTRADNEPSDSWLAAKTKIALYGDSRMGGSQLIIATKDGVVVIRGTVDSDQARKAATDLTKLIEGVKEVRNELRVTAAPHPRLEAKDEVIIAEVKNRLAKDNALKGSRIEVQSENGVVTLLGDVPNTVVAASAAEDAFKVGGVRYVKVALVPKPGI
jgi:hyperosmotically inducible protein